MGSERRVDYYLFLPAKMFRYFVHRYPQQLVSCWLGIIVKKYTYKIIYNTKYIVFFNQF